MTDTPSARAAVELRCLLQTLEHEGTRVIERVCGHEAPDPWVVYPGESGVFDRKARSQFYYHRHEPADHEAGHFHSVRLFPDRVAHLVGISMAPDGWPQALFTVNLWAVGDGEESVANLKSYVQRYRLDERRAEADMSRAGGERSRPLIAVVIRFVNLVFQAFRPEIEALQDEKAQAIEEYRRSHGGSDPFDDRSVDVLSRIAIDVRAMPGGTGVTGRGGDPA